MAPPKKQPAEPAYGELDPTLRVRYFPVTARVTDDILAWAKAKDVRIRAIIPVHWEGVDG